MINESEYFRPLWDEFDGEVFQDLVCDLLSAEDYLVEPSGVGPDGGIDAFAQQQIIFGYNNPEPFTWAVQCKFTSNLKKSISPSEVGPILNLVNDERFKSKNISGYFLVTNGRLSTNMMSELRGLKDVSPGFKTTYLDRSKIHYVLEKHFHVYKKYFAPPRREPEPSPTKVTVEEINEFETLINSPNTREVEIQIFLEAHPAFLSLGAIKGGEVISQVILQTKDTPALIPDFLINPGTNEPWAIVELKRPSVKLTLGQRGRRRLSSQIFEAIAQLRNYSEFFESPDNREEFKRKYGMDIYKPRLVVVLGRDYGELTRNETIKLRSQFPDVEILTYGDLLQRLKNVAE